MAESYPVLFNVMLIGPCIDSALLSDRQSTFYRFISDAVQNFVFEPW